MEARVSQTPDAAPGDPAPQQHSRTANGLTLRSFVIALVFSFIATLWVRRAELIAFACQITEATPPITSLAALLVLALLGPLLRRLGKWATLSKAEVAVIYAFVTIASLMSSVGVVRLLIPSVTVPFYFATPENQFANLQPYIPSWFAPHDPEALRALYEGLDKGQAVPWHLWLVPVLFWTGFLLVIWLTTLCLTVLIRRQWTETERLSFPLLYFPVELPIGIEGDGTHTPFFKNPLMWTGFFIAAVFNILNIAHAVNPGIPALGQNFNLGALFTERPWSYIQPLVIMHRPEVIGLSYLVSLEVLFSVWFCFLMERLGSMAVQAMGVQVPGFPLETQQGVGAFLAIAVLLLWLSRHRLAFLLQVALGRAKADDQDEPMSYRVAVWGALAGTVATIAICRVSGLTPWIAIVYFGLLAAFGFVYTRIRAEVGVPAVWAFPYYMARQAPQQILGSAPFIINGTLQNMTVFSSLFFLTRGYFTAICAYPLEFFKLSDETDMPRRQMLWTLILALVIGLLFAFWMHLDLYYQYGANVLEGGTTEGGYRTSLAVTEFRSIASLLKTPTSPQVPQIMAMIFGFVVAGALMICRLVFLRFPIHPLGYALATVAGQNLWGAFFITWLCKLTVLKLGGVRLYRKTLPGFIGLALGHFFTAGICWGVATIFFPDAARVWIVWFT